MREHLIADVGGQSACLATAERSREQVAGVREHNFRPVRRREPQKPRLVGHFSRPTNRRKRHSSKKEGQKHSFHNINELLDFTCKPKFQQWIRESIFIALFCNKIHLKELFGRGLDGACGLQPVSFHKRRSRQPFSNTL